MDDNAREFASFVRANAAALRRAAWLLTGDADEASDLVQDTLTRLYPKWERVIAADSALAYVRTCLLRRFLSNSRRLRIRTLSDAYADERGSERNDIEGVADRLLLATRLRELPPKQRAAIVLKFYYELTDREASAVLGYPMPTFRSHVRRGLAALRKSLGAGPVAAAALNAKRD